jgi:hypothetical protein
VKNRTGGIKAMRVETFDLCDLTETAEESRSTTEVAIPGAIPGAMAELSTWAVAQDRGDDHAIWDIETGPRPWEEIERFFAPPEKPGEFGPASVRYGNLKDPIKRREKLDAAISAHAQAVAGWQETVDSAKAEFLGRAALSPVTGRVLLIGVLADKDNQPAAIANDESEAAMIYSFWLLVDDWLFAKRPIVGHNSTAFDLPFLLRRSWCLGVPVPREVRQGRYWNPLFRDTMEWWNCGARDQGVPGRWLREAFVGYVKLNTLGAFFGVGQKTEGVAGGDFSKLWFGQMPAEQWGTPEEQRAKAIEYNAQDLRLTFAVARKMGMI